MTGRARWAGVAALAAASAGCFGTTWHEVGGGHAASGHVVVVGSMRLIPPIDPVSSHPVVLVGPMRDHVFALFTHDLSERFDPTRRYPLERYESVWLPMEGFFFLDVPEARPVYLRGFLYVTGDGSSSTETPLRIDLRKQDRVVYIGELNVIRGRPARVTVRMDEPRAQRAATEAGRSALLELPWTTREGEPAELTSPID